MKIKLYNGSSAEPNPHDPSVFYQLDFKTFELPPIQLGKEDPSKMRKKIRELRLDEIIWSLQNDPNLRTNLQTQREYKTALHKKISFSFALFVFTLIGLPIAVITRRGEAVLSFSFAMGIVALYYILFVWSWTAAVQGNVQPFLAMWFPNLFMMVCGIFLTRRILSA